MRLRITLISLLFAAMVQAQGIIDVHSHLITSEFVSALESEGKLMDEGFPLPKYDVTEHLRWMDEYQPRALGAIPVLCRPATA